ncbi:MAG: hypothetical protein NT062_31500 [Proteobacteria bacterium]|nr:hypothetical protein [Pseudomonadota bacterium]
MFRPALLLSLLAGCYRPSVESCQYTCSATQACPDGLACTNNQCAMPGDTCTGGDAAVPDAFVPTPCDNTFCIEMSGTVNNLNALWGTGPDDLWAVGDGGIVLHRTGTDAWDVVSTGPGPVTANLNDISGLTSNTTGPTLVIAGDGGNILTFDNQQWSIHLITGGWNLYGARAVGSNSTEWVVGAAGTVYARIIGEGWQDASKTESPVPPIAEDLYAITLAGANDLVIAGVGQHVYRRSPLMSAGGLWSPFTTGPIPSSRFVDLYAPPAQHRDLGARPQRRGSVHAHFRLEAQAQRRLRRHGRAEHGPVDRRRDGRGARDPHRSSGARLD